MIKSWNEKIPKLVSMTGPFSEEKIVYIAPFIWVGSSAKKLAQES
jgi:hypothetical protein